MAYRPKHILEYAVLRVVTALMVVLPLRGALGFGWVLARLSYPVIRHRAAEARRRMRQVFGPDVPEADIKKWAWLSWRNLFFNIIELARSSRINRRYVDAHVDHRQLEKLLARQREAGGYTLAVCHMGNWELAGFVTRMAGLPIFVMMRGQSNPLVTAYLNRTRERFGVAAIERHQALTSIAKRIRAGEVFTILPDIRAKDPAAAVVVPFLGHPAHLMGGTVLFARLTNTPIVTSIVTRVGWTRHKIEVQEPIYPDRSLERDDDVKRLLALVMARFDRAIREQPDQYFWYNKRWVLDDRF